MELKIVETTIIEDTDSDGNTYARAYRIVAFQDGKWIDTDKVAFASEKAAQPRLEYMRRLLNAN